MLRTFRQSWIPFSEWGYLILIATLAQATLLGILLIVSPLALLRRRITPIDSPIAKPLSGGTVRLRVFLYFLALGLGYLFVEMALIQRLVFFLANPIYAVAMVLASLLFVSGLGSAWAARQLRKGTSVTRLACLAAIIVAVTGTVYAFGLHAYAYTSAQLAAVGPNGPGIHSDATARSHGPAFPSCLAPPRPNPRRTLALGLGY